LKSIDKQITELRQALATAAMHGASLKLLEANIFKAESFSDIQAAYKLTVGLEENLNLALKILNGEDA
tara:strand:+ start:130 stop:333 length:204 start_codon:yes stop_codon:yes gene_type:complete